MSLINQVLRDLDQRHAGAVAVPAAVKALPWRPAPPAPRLRAITRALAALAAVGAAGAVAWTLGVRPTPLDGRAPAAARVDAAAAVPAPAVAPVAPSTPVVVVVAPPAAAAPPTAVAAVAPERIDRKAAPPQPTAPDAGASGIPAGTPAAAAAAQALVDSAPPAAMLPRGEARIDKRAPARTAHERADGEYQRGVAAHQQGQWTEAQAAYAAALREDASFAPARQALAGVLIGQGRGDDAKTLLTEGLADSPQHAGMALMLARLHAERGELQRAAEVLQSARLSSVSADGRAFHAAILQRLNRHAEAADLFASALQSAPGNGVWWMGLGISLAAEGRSDTARDAFSRARASGSLSPELAQYVEQRLRQLL